MTNPNTRLILLTVVLMLLLAIALYGVHPYLSAVTVCGLALMLLGFFAGWHIGWQDHETHINTRRSIPVHGRQSSTVTISGRE